MRKVLLYPIKRCQDCIKKSTSSL